MYLKNHLKIHQPNVAKIKGQVRKAGLKVASARQEPNQLLS